MTRKWQRALGLIYLSALVVAVVFVGSLNSYLRLTTPLGDALLVAGASAGAVAGVTIIIRNLYQQQRQLLSEKRRLEEVTANQERLIQEQQQAIADQAATFQEQASIISEQQEFRRALNHELRNPITAISVGVERLSAQSSAETVEQLNSDIERLARLLETVSALARLEVNPIDLLPVHVDDLISSVAGTLRATLTDRACSLSVESPAGPFALPPVCGDEDLLFILFDNLLSNAVKFTPSGGTVTVRTLEADGYVVIQICDTGLGMSATDVRQAGQPFRRGQLAQDHKIPGSGLGLFQAYKIVARHHGKISIQSQVGKGTVVTVQLPICDRSPAKSEEPTAEVVGT